MKTNKYLYVHVVQGYYDKSYGWEDLTESESYQEAQHIERMREDISTG